MAPVIDLAHVCGIGNKQASQVAETESNAAGADQIHRDMASRVDRIMRRLRQAESVAPVDVLCIKGTPNFGRSHRPPARLQFRERLANRQHQMKASRQMHDAVPIKIGAGYVYESA